MKRKETIIYVVFIIVAQAQIVQPAPIAPLTSAAGGSGVLQVGHHASSK